MLRNLYILSSFLHLLLLTSPLAVASEPSADAELERRLESSMDQIVALLAELPAERRQEVLRQLEQRLAKEAAPPERAPPERAAPEKASPEKAVPPVTAPAPSEPASAPPAAPMTTPAVSVPAPEPAPEPTPEPRSATPTDPSSIAPPLLNLRCQLALPLDSDGDQRLTALDRHWRHLYLWTDKDDDGQISERELESPYEQSIREISIGLRTFVRGKGKRKRTMDITVDERVIFDVDGDGYGGPIPRRDNGALVIDADGMRAANGPDLRASNGQPLSGFRALQPGQRWLLSDGSEMVPPCR